MNGITWGSARRWSVGGTLAALLAAALVAACGGGGGDTTAAGTTAAAYTAGPVRGFGSIIVNGVRFDDSGVTPEDEDAADRGSSKAVRLGTMVQIESGKVDDSTGRARALHIRFGSEIVGPIASIDAATTSFVVLGQTVDVKPETVFDDSIPGGFSGLAKDAVVEVHALHDAATGHYIATRVEAESGALFYKLRGVVSALDTTAKTFQIGSAVISYAGVGTLPAAFGDGLKVRVRLATTQASAGVWNAVTIASGVRRVDDLPDARLLGNVTAFTSATAFEVNGIPVDARNARIDNGPVTDSSRVEVRGTASNGTVVATRVTVLRANDDLVRGVELHGTISAPDAAGKTFTLRGVKVDWSDLTVFAGGTSAGLVEGAKVEVKGVLSSNGSTLAAVLIRFED
jgi:hypothetical protein